MTTARRLTAFLCALALVTGGCSWQVAPVETGGRAAPAESSKILAADGSLLAAVHGEEDREAVPLVRVPTTLRNAVVAVEDERFWRHRGVDVKALGRAVRANTTTGRVVEGASTITQQYVKNEVVGATAPCGEKLREALLAHRLERRLSKERILERQTPTPPWACSSGLWNGRGDGRPVRRVQP